MYPLEFLILKIKKKDLILLFNNNYSIEHIIVIIDYLIDGFTFKKAHKEAMKLVGE